MLTTRWMLGWAKLKCYKEAPTLAWLISACGKQGYVAFPLHSSHHHFSMHGWFLPTSQSNKKKPSPDRSDAGKVPSTPNSSLGKKWGNAAMSHGKQLSYRKQQPATLLTNQKVPNPVLVSKWKGCPPLPLQTPAELDHLLKYPFSATAVQQTLPSNRSHSTQIPSWLGARWVQSFC